MSERQCPGCRRWYDDEQEHAASDGLCEQCDNDRYDELCDDEDDPDEG